MKALISAFALLTFVAGTALPIETYAQTTGTGPDDVPGHLRLLRPPRTKKKKILQIPPCQKEVEEILHGADQLGQSRSTRATASADAPLSIIRSRKRWFSDAPRRRRRPYRRGRPDGGGLTADSVVWR